MAAGDRQAQALFLRVGHLLSAYHALAGLCSQLHLSLSSGLQHPARPLEESSAADLGPAAQVPAQQAPVSGAGLAAGAAASSCSLDGGCGSGESSAAGSSSTCCSGGADDQRHHIPWPCADSSKDAMEADPSVQAESGSSGQPGSTTPDTPTATGSSLQPHAGPAIGAALRPFAAAVDALIGSIIDEAQLTAWHFVLEYNQVRSCVCV